MSDFAVATNESNSVATNEGLSLANAAYKDMVDALRLGEKAANILLGKGTQSHQFRGLLLGRSLDKGASYKELLDGRLNLELPGICSVGFDLVNGNVFGLESNGQTMLPNPRNNKTQVSMKVAIDRFCKATSVLLVAYAPMHISRF